MNNYIGLFIILLILVDLIVSLRITVRFRKMRSEGNIDRVIKQLNEINKILEGELKKLDPKDAKSKDPLLDVEQMVKRKPLFETMAVVISNVMKTSRGKVDEIFEGISNSADKIAILLKVAERGDRFEFKVAPIMSPTEARIIMERLNLKLAFKINPDVEKDFLYKARLIVFGDALRKQSEYYGVLVSKAYEDEWLLRNGCYQMIGKAMVKLKKILKLKEEKSSLGITIEECGKLCEGLNVNFKSTNNYLKRGEDYSLLCIPHVKDVRPWVLSTFHLGESRTPPWKHYLALMVLLRKIEER